MAPQVAIDIGIYTSKSGRFWILVVPHSFVSQRRKHQLMTLSPLAARASRPSEDTFLADAPTDPSVEATAHGKDRHQTLPVIDHIGSSTNHRLRRPTRRITLFPTSPDLPYGKKPRSSPGAGKRLPRSSGWNRLLDN